MRFGKLISTYLIKAVLPYFGLAWLILTVVLFLQQAGRYSEIFFTPNLPSSFAWQITAALIPSVIAFTCPMAVLVGVIVGLSRMHADSEIVAMKSFGIGSLEILLPIIGLGTLLSVLSLIINIFGVPLAARAVRATALQSAIYKLESPIEPGVFNSEIAGFTIYVKGGDLVSGSWKDVIIFTKEGPGNESRLITSATGRIDAKDQSSELVLQNATVITFKSSRGAEGIVSERLGEIRLGIRTRRDEMVDRLSAVQPSLEEMGLGGLFDISRAGTDKERREATILILRRLILSGAPLLFCLLGTVIVLRYDRRGRGFGVILAIIVLIAYFFFTFAGEQLARSGAIEPIVGALLPVSAALTTVGYLLLAARFPRTFEHRFRSWLPSISLRRMRRSHRGTDVILDITTGLRDFEILAEHVKYFVLAFSFIASIFIVFTAFELWRFAGSFERGPFLLLQYIIFLVPFIYLQVSSTAVLIAILTVLTVKSRQNEVVTWLMAGQSVYRLIFPILLLMLFLGFLNFAIQEHVAAESNIRQDQLRQTIRSRGAVKQTEGVQWVADGDSIYAFEFDRVASDNGSPDFPICVSPCSLKNISIFNFEANRAELQSVYRIPAGTLDDRSLIAGSGAEILEVSSSSFRAADLPVGSIPIGFNFAAIASRLPSQMSVGQLKESIARADADVEVRVLAVALERKYSTIAMPLVIALIAIPFGIAIERRNRVVHIAFAVGLWLIFVATSSIFEQFGSNGTLPPTLAVWSPILLFSIIGVYLISKIRT